MLTSLEARFILRDLDKILQALSSSWAPVFTRKPCFDSATPEGRRRLAACAAYPSQFSASCSFDAVAPPPLLQDFHNLIG